MIERFRSATAEIIYNPGAGNNSQKAKLVIEAEQRLREHGISVKRRRTERPGHATELARDAAGRGVSVVFAMGGDGTLNEVGKGLLYSNTVLGVLPQGTVNVFAKETGIPKDPKKAVDIQLAGDIHTMDAARFRFKDGPSHDMFLMGGIGYDGLVFNSVQQTGKRRKKSGQRVYLWQAIKQLRNADTPPARLIADGQEIKIKNLSQMWINNTQNVATLRLRPDTRADDGKFGVTIFDGKHSGPKRNILSLAKNLALKFLGRRGPSSSERQIQASKLLLTLERPLFAEVDGEPIGSGKEIEIVVLKDALKVLAPRDTEIFSKGGFPTTRMQRANLALAA